MKSIRVVVASLLLVMFVGMGITLTGCQNAAEEAAEEAAEAMVEGVTGVDVETDENKVTIEGEDGSTVEIQGSEGELPEDFPNDVPVYDAAIESSTRFTADGDTSFMISQTTSDSFDDVVEWLNTELADNGWTESGNTVTGVDGAEFALIQSSKDGNELTFSVQYEEGSDVQIALSLLVQE